MKRIPIQNGPPPRTVESDGLRLAFPPHEMQDPEGTIYTVFPARALSFTSIETEGEGPAHPAVRVDSWFSNTSLLYVMSAAELRAVALSFNEVAQAMEDNAGGILKAALDKRTKGGDA